MDGAKRCMMLARYDLCAGEGLKSTGQKYVILDIYDCAAAKMQNGLILNGKE
jgi:hypothetical protein